jgi:hypothetical protein
MPHISKRSHEGLLIIDHSESPGITADDLQGKPGIAVGGGTVAKMPTLQCCHCNVTVILNPLRNRPRNYCSKCDAYICDQPGCNAQCVPFEKIVDRIQEAGAKNIPVGDVWLP